MQWKDVELALPQGFDDFEHIVARVVSSTIKLPKTNKCGNDVYTIRERVQVHLSTYALTGTPLTNAFP
jgi:hypothetical protein